MWGKKGTLLHSTPGGAKERHITNRVDAVGTVERCGVGHLMDNNGTLNKANLDRNNA